MPHINTSNTFVAHDLTVSGSKVLNFAYEWNATMNHTEWVAFSFDELTCKDVTKRTDAWDVDPLLPESMRTSNANHTNDGFDRGHICASEDRVWSVDANKQTFYFSNMSPQLASFNQNFWVAIENQVRLWGRAIPNTYDKVYVTKGGTMNHLLKNFTSNVAGADGKYPTTDENGFTIKGLACPQYYFTAVLADKNGEYKAIAFLVEHKEGLPKKPTAAEMQEYVVSIDELESFTGIDFFCNLPDDIENVVESSYSIDDWAW
ncbi:DNA/RNA non-specific endonuclease [Bacteroides sp. 214]|uniref:DNA/RNA non-specific endonuclease n=1 Tax=Bacteroides sp. 214 TaxID=2302935 RepID=UPI00351B0817